MSELYEDLMQYYMKTISRYTIFYMSVTHSPRNSEDMGSNPGTGRYIVAGMTT